MPSNAMHTVGKTLQYFCQFTIFFHHATNLYWVGNKTQCLLFYLFLSVPLSYFPLSHVLGHANQISNGKGESSSFKPSPLSD